MLLKTLVSSAESGLGVVHLKSVFSPLQSPGLNMLQERRVVGGLLGVQIFITELLLLNKISMSGLGVRFLSSDPFCPGLCLLSPSH